MLNVIYCAQTFCMFLRRHRNREIRERKLFSYSYLQKQTQSASVISFIYPLFDLSDSPQANFPLLHFSILLLKEFDKKDFVLRSFAVVIARSKNAHIDKHF